MTGKRLAGLRNGQEPRRGVDDAKSSGAPPVAIRVVWDHRGRMVLVGRMPRRLPPQPLSMRGGR